MHIHVCVSACVYIVGIIYVWRLSASSFGDVFTSKLVVVEVIYVRIIKYGFNKC